MMTAYDLKQLFHRDFRAWEAVTRRNLELLDRMIAEQEKAEAEEAAAGQWDPIPDLSALGLDEPEVRWRAGVVLTRVWLLRIASGLEDDARPSLPTYGDRGSFDATTPFAQWELWRYLEWQAEGVRAERRARRFGPKTVTDADREEARLKMEMSNEQYVAIRERAAWVLR